MTKLFFDECLGYAQQTLCEKYGDPRTRGWAALWLLHWKIRKDFQWFPASTIRVHRDFQPRLYYAFKSIEHLGLHTEIKTFDQAFRIRRISRNTPVLSVHSWGAAIDLNAGDNPPGSPGKLSRQFIDIMLQNGVFCGQNWAARPDAMHFAMVNGY